MGLVSTHTIDEMVEVECKWSRMTLYNILWTAVNLRMCDFYADVLHFYHWMWKNAHNTFWSITLSNMYQKRIKKWLLWTSITVRKLATMNMQNCHKNTLSENGPNTCMLSYWQNWQNITLTNCWPCMKYEMQILRFYSVGQILFISNINIFICNKINSMHLQASTYNNNIEQNAKVKY